MSNKLIIVSGIAGSGKTTKCKDILTQNPDYIYLNSDDYFKKYNQNEFKLNLLGTIDTNEILHILENDFDTALVYTNYFMSLYTSVVLNLLRTNKPNSYILELPFVGESFRLIYNTACNLGYEVEYIPLNEYQSIISERLTKRNWSAERIFLTIRLFNHYYES